LDPQNMRARQGKMLALYFDGQIDAALELGKESLTVNPGDTEFLSEYGERLAISGNWTEGCPLISEARQLNPGESAYYEVDLALCSYFGADYKQAVIWLEKAASPTHPIYHLVAAAIYGEAGKAEEARRSSVWLQQNSPGLVKNLRRQVSMRFHRAQDAEAILGSLRKAGLVIPD
ncbi:tetratricopeptide repeat protein, partial [Mesorhizobium humile]